MSGDPSGLFDDRAVLADLRGRVMRGGALKAASRVVLFSLRVAGVVVMARLVSPDDYGVFLMATSFTMLLTMFDDIGLARATVQRKEVTPEQVSTLFWVNAGAGLLFAVVVLAAAPMLAWSYREPRLLAVTMAMSIPFVLSGLAVQHEALLQRQMRFGVLEGIALAAQLSGALAMFTAGWLGAAYWALVLNNLVLHLIETALMWRCSGWRPGWPRLDAGVRGMLVFGGHLSGANFVNYFNRNLDNILIGLYWGPAALGFYSKAYGLLKQPLSQIGTPSSAVIVPALSRLQEDPQRYRSYFVKAMRAVLLVAMPMVAFTFVDAREAVLILLGVKWLPVVPLFKALAPAALLGVSQVFASWLFLSLGRGKDMLKVSTATLGVMVVAFGAGLPWGAMGVAVAYSAAYALVVYPTLSFAARGTPVSTADIGSAAWRPVLYALAAGALTLRFQAATPLQAPAARCAADAAVFSLCYASLWALFPGGREYVASVGRPVLKWAREALGRPRG